MKIKSKDKIIVMKGAHKGKIGRVLQVLPQSNTASVEDINIHIKNLKSQKKGEKGHRISFPAPIPLENLELLCPKCSKPTRVGFKILESKKKARVCKKCNETID